MSGPPPLRLERVSCVRGGRLLFQELDLRLEPGASAILTGPNGAGKSSLLRLAAGLLRPASGSVHREAAALADESLALDARLTLESALAFWAGLDGASSAPGIKAMGLTDLREVPVRLLSTGQRRRATLARVISSGAPLWLLDEPANGLDQEGAERLSEAMSAHLGSGGAILAASHQPLGLPGAAEVALG